MKTIRRVRCVLTGQNDLEQLYVFRKFPVFMGSTLNSPANDLISDMSWLISKSSGIIQLENLIPLEVLYSESHGSGRVGNLWQAHHKAFANFINLFSPSAVFEIGGSHGILALEYNCLRPIPWVILEPNPVPIDDCPAIFLKGFFDENYKHYEFYDTVVHSHVFEHIYEPTNFIQNLSKMMEEGKLLIFSIPNMQRMLEQKYINCINFEHTIFLSESYVDYLLSKYGFKILKKEYFHNDHSIFYSARREKIVQVSILSQELYFTNKALFIDYINYYKKLVVDLNEKIAAIRNPIFLFGAHVFSQYLLNLGLHSERILFVLDNDAEKQAKRLYGANLYVRSPTCLKDYDSPVVILKAGAYNDEIKKDILMNINRNVIFW